MSKTITVTGAVDAADTRVLLTAQGSVSAPSLVIPAGKTRISKVIAVVASDGLADDGMGLFFVRLGGAAVLNGESQIVFAGLGNQAVQAGSDAAPSIGKVFVLNDADIAVSPSDTISISAEGAGVDWGDSQVTVSLVYE